MDPLSVIASTIAILQATAATYRAIQHLKGLPKEFDEVYKNLPVAQDTLRQAHDHLQGQSLDDASKTALQPVVSDCERDVAKLHKIFETVANAVKNTKNGSVLDFYRTSLLRLGKANRVETLMRGVLSSLDKLATNRLFQTATQNQVAQLKESFEKLSTVESSVPNSEFEDLGTVMNQSIASGGTGHQSQYSGQGQQILSGSGRQFNAHTMHFGSPREYEKTRESVLQALHTSSYRERKNRNPDRVPGTCLWFENHSHFKRWRDSKSSGMLWVSANPGCGKSVLAKYLVDSVLPTGNSRITCYFFFKEDYEDQRSAKSALSCILHQLFVQNPVLLSNSIVKRFSDNKQHFTKSFDELWDILIMASQDSNTEEIVCVIDAFDECEDADRRRLSKALREFYGLASETKNNVNLKFLVTSRPYGNIGRSFQPLDIEGLPIIHLKGENDLETSNIAQEIDLYIQFKVLCIRDSWKLTHDETELLLRQLKRIPSQTYLWAYLTLELFEEDLLVSKEFIREATSSLPQTVEDAYEKILRKSSCREEARKMLHIVVAAARPLTLLEMRLALAWRQSDKSYHDLEERIVPEERFSDHVRDICGIFVTIKDSRIYLLHQTAKEFLVCPKGGVDCQESHDDQLVWKYSLRPQVSHNILYKVCIGYLYFTDFNVHPLEREEDIPQYLDEHVFLGYSAVNWAAHFRASGIRGVAQLQEICDPESTRCLNWFKLYWRIKYSDSPPRFTTLMIASYFGLEEMVLDQLASDDVELDLKSDRFQLSALSWASNMGFDGVVRLLITPPVKNIANWSSRKGADINTRDYYCSTPLFHAATKGHTAIVCQLISAGADIEAKNYFGSTPLRCAFYTGHEAIVRLLLKNGARLDGEDESGCTLLHIAVFNGKENLVQLLLQNGADLNARDVEDRTPLHYAALEEGKAVVVVKERRAIVELLLKQGADCEAKDRNGFTPLQSAIATGPKDLIRLLDRGTKDLPSHARPCLKRKIERSHGHRA